MQIVDWLQPRHERTASRIVAILTMVSAGITFIFTLTTSLSPSGSLLDLVGIVLATAVFVLGYAAMRLGGLPRLVWAVCPFAATATIVALDMFTADATITAQVFLLFPALYAASQLRRTGTMLVIVVVVAAELVITFRLLPAETALIESSYMVAALVTTAVLLCLAGERQDQLIAQLERQAAVDPLTGLVTRRVLDEAARAAIAGARGLGGTGLVLIDIDNFKVINDTYGHPVGDEILVQLAALLISSSRPTDIVSRLGGDEIALLMPGLSAVSLDDRAREILLRVRGWQFLIDRHHTVPVSISGGFAHASTTTAELRALYVAADGALYRAKRAGRNRMCSSAIVELLEIPPPARA